LSPANSRSSRAPSRKRRPTAIKSTRTKRKSFGWLDWWPVAAGIVIAPFAVRAVQIMTLTGPWGARAIVPWTFLLQGHSLHMPEAWADHLVEGVMYAQFPIYGLMAVLLHRKLRWSTTLAMIVALHVLGFAVLAAVEQS
jgi:hypothetical protein